MGEGSRPAGAGPAPGVSCGVVATLSAPIRGPGDILLEPVCEAHREPLRAACAQDQDIWEIYPFSMIDDHFDPAFDAMMSAQHRIAFTASLAGVVVGTTSYLAIDPAHHIIEIGGTFFAPPVRGTGFNMQVKHLMINHAIDCGFTRIELRADARNTRSCAAIAKLGAVYEGTLRKNRITWTGHQRDTAIYAILANEWLDAHRA